MTKLIGFSERLLVAMELAGVSQSALARAIKVNKSAINQVLSGASKGMKPPHLVLTCRHLNIRPEWLVFGEEPMRPIPVTNDDFLLLRMIHTLPQSYQSTIQNMVRDLSASYSHDT